MSETAPITEEQLARLRAVAEDPLIAPSKRIEARTILKTMAREQESARDSALRRQLQAKIRAGRDLTWRERAVARQLGLVAGRDDD